MIERLKQIRINMLREIALLDEIIDEKEQNGNMLLNKTTLSTRTVKLLEAAGCKILKDIGHLSLTQIGNIPNLGKKELNEIIYMLKKEHITIVEW